jgi:hypothetical protein
MRRKRWLILLIVVGILALGIFLGRGLLIHAVYAQQIYQAKVFIPPPLVQGESGWSRFWADARFYWDISGFELAREERTEQLKPQLKPLVKEIKHHQENGEGMQYSMHIYREIRWMLNFTSDDKATRARIEDLKQSLTQPEMQKQAAGQHPSDGSWGLGINTWYLRLYYSVEDGGLEDGPKLKYPLSFLDRVNSPEKLTAQLDSVLHNDFTKTGVFNREELDETFSAMARLLFRGDPNIYPYHPQLKNALREFVEGWQNPATGCWGQWLLDRDGRIWKMDDVGITFHVVSDFKGEINHLDLISKRVLELDSYEFPAGIQFNGHYENHLNWDVVKIFRYAWPYLDEPARQQVRAEINKMLDWCLKESYQPDGSFKVSDLDDTLGDAFQYGVSFLRDVGYFQRKRRFWTDQDFPQAKAVCENIRAKLKSIGLDDPGLKDAYESLPPLE